MTTSTYGTSDAVGAHSATETQAASTPPAPNSSIGELLSQITRDLSELMHQEIELAKAEAKTEAKKAGKAAGMFGGAGFSGYMVAVFGTVTVLAALAVAIPVVFAALIVTAIWGVVGAILAMRGRQEVRRIQGMPQTKETLKEDAQWARHPIN